MIRLNFEEWQIGQLMLAKENGSMNKSQKEELNTFIANNPNAPVCEWLHKVRQYSNPNNNNNDRNKNFKKYK
jgi:hypothetical protein